jgi:hypothetical protein
MMTLIESCPSAEVYIPEAMLKKEAMLLVTSYFERPLSIPYKAIKEYGLVVTYLKDTGRLPVPVKAQHVLYDRSPHGGGKVVVLSPSNAAVLESIRNLTDLAASENPGISINLERQSQNLNAVALHYSMGAFAALLGSDLEEDGAHPDTGWSGIIGNRIFNRLSLSQAMLYKVAHHGSATGHHDGIWTDLLQEFPLSIGTPYNSSDLPAVSDIARIKGRSSEFIVTRDPRSRGKVKRSNLVEKEVKQIGAKIQAFDARMGHIQVRVSKRMNFQLRGTRLLT